MYVIQPFVISSSCALSLCYVISFLLNLIRSYKCNIHLLLGVYRMKTADWVWSLMFSDWGSCVVINYNYAFTHGGVDENNKRKTNYTWCRLQWSRGLRRWPAAVQFLGFRVWIPTGTRMSVSCECGVCSGGTLCVFGLITRPEESYRVRCVWVWSRNLDNEEALATRSWCAMKLQWIFVHDTQSAQRDYPVTYLYIYFFLQKFSFLNNVGFK